MSLSISYAYVYVILLYHNPIRYEKHDIFKKL